MQTAYSKVLSSSPNAPAVDGVAATAAAMICAECSLACMACADACLGESEIDPLRRCIRLNLDCADVCAATARMLTRRLEADLDLLGAQLRACLQACISCGAECLRHGSDHAHCQWCADACRACEDKCRDLIGLFPDERRPH